MARSFTVASSAFLEHSGAVVVDEPITVSCWFNSADVATNYILVSLSDTSGQDRHLLTIRGADAGDFCRAFSLNAGGNDFAVTGNAFMADTWHHLIAVWASDTSRSIMLDGDIGNKGTNATDLAIANIDNAVIGAQHFLGSPAATFFEGLIGECGIWDTGLTDAQGVALSKGYSPLLVRPQNLVAYWSLVRGLNDIVGGFNFTNTNTTIAPHPRIIYPSSQFINSVAAGAPPGTVPKGPLTHPLYGPFAGPIAC